MARPALEVAAIFRDHGAAWRAANAGHVSRGQLQMLRAAHAGGRLEFFADHGALADGAAFASYLQPLRRAEWVVYAKKPFGGPQAVLAYLSRYTHRVAIANRRLVTADECGVTFRYKDYRIDGPGRYKTMMLAGPPPVTAPRPSSQSITSRCHLPSHHAKAMAAVRPHPSPRLHGPSARPRPG